MQPRSVVSLSSFFSPEADSLHLHQEFLLFLLPLINLRKLRLRLSRLLGQVAQAPKALTNLWWSGKQQKSQTSKTASSSELEPSDGTSSGPLMHLPGHVCAICYSRSAMPTHLGIADAADPTDPTKAALKQASSFPAASSSSSDAAAAAAAGGGENDVHVPYQVDCCQASYCYYCITSELVQWEESKAGLDGPWSCLRCGQGVTHAQAVH